MNKRLSAFVHAISGLRYFFKETIHAKFHVISALVVCLAGFYWQLDYMAWVAILLCMAMVFCLEAVNSALEYVVDLASPNISELAKKAKDVAAGAVLLAAFFSIIIAILIFAPKIY